MAGKGPNKKAPLGNSFPSGAFFILQQIKESGTRAVFFRQFASPERFYADLLCTKNTVAGVTKAGNNVHMVV